MRNFKLFLVTLSALWFFIGCSQVESPVGPSQNSDQLGAAKVNIQIGRIGQLSKISADIVLAKLFITMTAPGEATISDTAELTSNGGTSFMKTYNDMASLKPWTLFVVSVDQEGTVIHTGSKTFEIQPRHTEPVNLNLNSKYSMLKVNFYPIRDSVTKVELKLNGLVINDSVFAKQIFKGDTVKMSYNYMDTGTQHITLNAYGTMWGDENVLLYTADTTVSVLTGVDANYTVKLVWVGPTTPPAGQASMAVSLGSTGTTVINAYIDPPYRFYKFIINSVGFGAYNPCLITTHFMMGDTAYPKDISGATVISNSEVSCGTVENLLMGLGYLKPLGGVCPWEWVVDMHQAYLFTDFYIYCAEVGFYGAPTSITIYGGDSSEGPWNVIGEQTFTEAYNGATIPLHY